MAKTSKKTENLLEYTPWSFDHLSETHKTHRKRMADILEAVCIDAGATVTREEGGPIWPKSIRLAITGARGMHIGIDFDGNSCQPNVYVGTWNLPTHSTDRFNPEFFGDAVNKAHFQKVTVVGCGLYNVILQITRHLEAGFDGTAFSAEVEAEYARKTAAGEHLWQRIYKHQQENPGVPLLP